LTQGYWKTHNSLFGADGLGGRKGPPIHDWTAAPAWENWQSWKFFTGTPEPVRRRDGSADPQDGTPTWFTTFTTPPKGNPYYQAADQFMAATLNVANGADGSIIAAELKTAYQFFLSNTPTSWLGFTNRTALIGWSSLFASFNEGTLTGGPAHCDEVVGTPTLQ
jgi:hypothetical protein